LPIYQFTIGLHRYAFVLFRQQSSIDTSAISLNEEGEITSLRSLAENLNLTPVGGSFMQLAWDHWITKYWNQRSMLEPVFVDNVKLKQLSHGKSSVVKTSGIGRFRFPHEI